MQSALEAHAEQVAKRIAPEEVEREGERGFDIMTIITVVITIFQTIIQNCPVTKSVKRAGMKKPSLRQRAALMKTTIDVCKCCGLSHLAGSIYNAMSVHGTSLADVDANALIEESETDSNLLV